MVNLRALEAMESLNQVAHCALQAAWEVEQLQTKPSKKFSESIYMILERCFWLQKPIIEGAIDEETLKRAKEPKKNG